MSSPTENDSSTNIYHTVLILSTLKLVILMKEEFHLQVPGVYLIGIQISNARTITCNFYSSE